MKEKLIFWNYFTGTKKVYTESKETKNTLIKNKQNKLSSTYYFKDGKRAWDIIILSKSINKLKRGRELVKI